MEMRWCNAHNMYETWNEMVSKTRYKMIAKDKQGIIGKNGKKQ